MSEEAPSCFLYRFPGAWWNCTRISASRLCSALPALIGKGTPSQRALSTKSAIAANVGHREPGGTVSSSGTPAVCSRFVLPQHDVGHVDRADGADHLHLLVANVLRIQTRGLLHGEQRHHLQQVVLNHVADDPVVVKITAPSFGAEVLGEADLHVADVRARPQRGEDDVGEPQDRDVLDELLA